jgi:hypothetical protein
MSNLEKLPTELLVTIFLCSMNMDLPRASPVIGGKLSSEAVYARTVIAAFGPTWEQAYGRHSQRISPSVGDGFAIRRTVHGVGDHELQVSS